MNDDREMDFMAVSNRFDNNLIGDNAKTNRPEVFWICGGSIFGIRTIKVSLILVGRRVEW